MDIAIIGVSCRLPDADNYSEFWGNIVNHRNSVVKISSAEQGEFSLPRATLKWPAEHENRFAALINRIDGFDNQFFGIIPKVAETMDPQQRIMLENTWTCLEDAGIPPSSLRGKKVGVIIGVFNNDYKELQENTDNPIEAHHSTGTATSIIANRISHFFDFHGPSLALDTACSSSLNAIHAAVQAIRNGDCEIALSGGVNLILTSTRHQSFAKMGMLSPSGACHSFDDQADGYVRGEGAAVLLLKPLDKALADGDTVHGVIKGSAVNHCGNSYTLTYPSADAQADVIIAAHRQAGVPINSIGLIEAHGTGTPKGDPIEFAGLKQAFSALAQQQDIALEDGFCGVTSVKSNIGHLEAAAGVAGVIKVLQAFRHRQLPPLRHFSAINPKIDVQQSPFFFVDQTTAWPRIDDATPRRAGVSSFGFGGTNAHVVLEEAPEPLRRRTRKKSRPTSGSACLIALSAKSPEALLQRQMQLIQWLQAHPDASLDAVSATLLTRRDHFPYRFGCVGHEVQSLVATLETAVAQGLLVMQAHEDAEAEEAGAQARALLEHLARAKSPASESQLAQLADCYQRGARFEGSALFANTDVQAVSLPTYPFIHQSFWITPPEDGSLDAQRHRVLNVGSTRYQAVLQADEFFVAGHRMGGQAILPGVMYLELVRAAFTDSIRTHDLSCVQFSQVRWLQPLEFTERAREIEIHIHPLTAGQSASFEVKGDDNILYCRGTLSLAADSAAKPAARIAGAANTLSGADCYQRLDGVQMVYGAGLQSIAQLTFDAQTCIAQLQLPAGQDADFVIHPSLADGALQAAVVWINQLLNAEASVHKHGAMVIPFMLESLELRTPCVTDMTATLTLAAESSLKDGMITVDIQLADARQPERVAMSFRGLSLRVLDEGFAAKALPKTARHTLSESVNLYQPYWIEKAVDEADVPLEQVVLVGAAQDIAPVAMLFAEKENPPAVYRLVLDAAAAPFSTSGAVRPANLEDFSAAVDALLAQGATFRQVLWVNGGQSNEDSVARLTAGPLSLFALTKALMRKVRQVRFVHLHHACESPADILGISGFYRTLRVEKPDYIGRVVQMDNGTEAMHLPALIAREFNDLSKDADVRHVQGTRWVRRFASATTPEARADAPKADTASLRRHGIYLITGGMGALGLIFARYLCEHYAATVYLSGRSALDATRRQQLDALCASGGKAHYLACDIGDAASVQQMIDTIFASEQTLNGVIHSAGVIEDNFILRKSPEAFARVITPKVLGTTLLDSATRHLPLDFFALFSSVTGVLGNMGQCDYAFGNAFEDYFAHQRNAQQQRGERVGKALSINWPYWQDGGMRLTEKEAGFLKSQFGIVPLLTEDGIAAFDFALQSRASQTVVMPGDASRIEAVLGVVETTRAPKIDAPSPAQDLVASQEAVIGFLSALFAQKLQIPAHFERHAFFRDYGFDSVVVIDLVNALKKTFGNALPMTLFFEYQTMEELSRYLLDHHAEAVAALQGKAAAVEVLPQAASPAADYVRETPSVQSAFASRRDVKEDDIAIIGIAGRYPQADNLAQFWDNLAAGRDCVTEVPAERWDTRWFQPGAATPGKSYSRWGGFLSGVERFDPRYFNISPKETEIMDPNEWLFLETVTHAIEDAGYTADKLAAHAAGRENRVGVYVGMMWGDYQLNAITTPVDEWNTSHSSYWSVANRVSHFYNFSGPSMAVDTACSSSLTAIHVACHALRSGDVPVAIAGGINLSLHPYKYHLLSNMHFLSSDGRCRSFGEGGTGYVPGEGVGAVVLKPLSLAREQGDHIYGIIRGTAVNHGGKTSGFTVPNAKRQAELITDALATAKVNPRHISYVEAHGTGTKLGDPIEISGLNKAFYLAGDSAKYCAIGSVKANIGHLEAAAGMSALTKVLLQMKHQTLVPSIQSDTVNPFIDFENGPFRLQHALAPWPRPVLPVQEQGATVATEIPRMAGISSFGAGGSNAHLIVEEYSEPPRLTDDHGKPALIVLSARREAALQTMAGQLATFIEQHGELSLQDIAYTLQVGRVAHEHRLALVADVAADAVAMLRAYGQQPQRPVSGLITGHRDTARNTAETPPLADWLTLGRLGALGEAWAKGHEVDWTPLHSAHARRRVSLPGYAFQRQNCWAPTAPVESHTVSRAAALHPLIDANISTLAVQAFRKTLRADEFLVNDHRLGDNRILPGAAFIEMALGAGELALLGKALPQADAKPVLARVQDITWRQPVRLTGATLDIDIALTPSQGGLNFEIYQTLDEKRHLFGSGRLTDETASQPAPVNLQSLVTHGQSYEREAVNAAFAERGFTFGPAFQVIERLYAHADEALAELTLLPEVNDAQVIQPFILPPSWVDGAFRTALGIGGFDAATPTLEVPVALRGVQIYAPIHGICYAYARRCVQGDNGNTTCYDIDLLDNLGNVVVRVEQLQTQAVPHLGLKSTAVANRAGQAERFTASLVATQPTVTAAVISEVLNGHQGGAASREALINSLIAQVIEVTRLDADEVTATAPLADFGLDSMMILALNEKLSATFSDLSQTLFYEHESLASLADCLLEHYPQQAMPSHEVTPALNAIHITDARSLRDGVTDFLTAGIIEVTKLDAREVQPATQLADYGLDSMMILALNEKLAATFGEVSQTLFYEYQDIDALAEFLCESYPGPAAALQPAVLQPVAALPPAQQPQVSLSMATPVTANDPARKPDTVSATCDLLAESLTVAIAPNAANVSTLMPLHQWPLDPVVLLRLQHELDARFTGVKATAVYHYQTLVEWAVALCAGETKPVTARAPQPVTPSISALLKGGRFDALQSHAAPQDEHDAIAVIGLSGRYPGAKNVDEFWANLTGGVDSVSEIPLSRWDYRDHYSPERGPKNKVYSKWGGFIEDIDQFDSQYFSISPREAELLDPQERLFLQTAWECVSDASYSRQALNQHPVGVFVGVMWGHYQSIDTTPAQYETGYPMSLHSSVANRVSYYFNLDGPSVALDTMCSSSLTALHLACQAIRSGDCKMAIAGGVNLIVHPMKYYQLGQSQFLSSDGRCRAFGEGGDGYVPGEGMGAVLLKPLQQAIADGDQIYGVIRATAINHGGKTSGFTVPNQAAQSQAISTALERAGWEPASVDYIEAHGTGTLLGDPIEISGLSKAFARVNAQKGLTPPLMAGHCRIGSVKSNIGHLESAAGIAGLTKILLQMRHRKLVPSLHSQTLNPKINFAASPFRVVQTLEDWASTAGKTRRAGLSAFGAGGSNASVFIEEAPLRASNALHHGEPCLFVLSADTDERLSRYVSRMMTFLERVIAEPETAPALASLAYSSLVGRDGLAERLAVVATSLGDLLDKLANYRDQGHAPQLFRGRIAGSQDRLDSILDAQQLEALIDGLVQGREQVRLGRLWTTTLDVNWQRVARQLFDAKADSVRRVSFPPLPLMPRTHWLARPDEQTSASRAASLHPLIDENISTLSQQKFAKQFSGQESYLRDHVVGSDMPRKILPGSAYLEMLHAAGQRAIESEWQVGAIRHLMWMNTLDVNDEPVNVAVELAHREGESVGAVVNLRDTGVTAVEAELVCRPKDVEIADEWIDLEALIQRGRREDDSAAMYREFAGMGFAYGPSYQVTRARYRFNDAALSHLQLPESALSADHFMLHPSLLDGALRTCLAVGLEPVAHSTPMVPFYLGELTFRHPLGRECYAYVTPAASGQTDSHIQKHDITLLDTQGRVLARLTDFAARRLEKSADAAPPHAQQDVQFYGYAWQPSPLAAASAQTTAEAERLTMLVIGDDAALAEALTAQYGEAARVVSVTQGAEFIRHDATHFSVDTQSASSVHRLCEQLDAASLWPSHIVQAIGASRRFDDLPHRGAATTLNAGLKAFHHLFVALDKQKPRQVMRCATVYCAPSDDIEPQLDALSGYARSLLTLNHRFELFTLRSDVHDAAALAAQISQEFSLRNTALPGLEVAYFNGTRFQRQLAEIPSAPVDAGSTLPLVQQGHYLITGGAGKLGMVMAQYLASRCQARLVLTGRSSQPDAAAQQQIDALREQGAEVRYLAADIAEDGQAEQLIAQAKAAFGPLDGVLHCAGVASATPMNALQDAEFMALVGPKIAGLVALDRATALEPLSLFVNFSSVSAVLGDLGSGAYAAGNRFMDSHAVWRRHHVARGARSGLSLSVNWPLWADGQMSIAGEDATLLTFSGMAALQQQAGIAAFERALREQRAELLVIVGDRAKVARALRIQNDAQTDTTAQHFASSETQTSQPLKRNGDSEAPKASDIALKQHIAHVTKIPAREIDVEATFEQLGMDSVMLMELRAELEKEYAGLSKTAPFEYNTTAKLAAYLHKRYGTAKVINDAAPLSAANAAPTGPVSFKREQANTAQPDRAQFSAARASLKSSRASATPFTRTVSTPPFTAAENEPEGVAIIGVAGEFPGVDSLAEFWTALQEGKENLTPIPEDRWTLGDEQPGNPRYVNRGGFLKHVNDFDPQMFRMSHDEASRLDPQVRVLLRSAWHAMEDAGYTPSALSAQQVGVYVGAMNEDFTWVMSDHFARTGHYPGAGAVISELANRISYLMNLRGPSFTLATTCASSLTSVHIARKAILGGECDMALAGGVNLSLHPSKYMLLQDMKVLSADGKEHTFDEQASGLIPSEGSGMVVLKRLSTALADGDTIYGVLRGSSLGHAGTGAGQYLPNLSVMEETAVRALNEARIDVNELSYIESHGAATELGDPIELKALSNALRRHTEAAHFCALGTKANLGHMEAASGICSLIKVLLSMQHGRLSPCVNLNRVNASFEQEASPFLFPTEAQPWNANARGTRLAGINAYGMGGSTAFVVLESPEAAQPAARIEGSDVEPQIVVLSARRADRLAAYAVALHEFVGQPGRHVNLADLAYTSQLGRAPFEYRLAIVATSIESLQTRLAQFIAQPNSEQGSNDLYCGNVFDNREVTQLIAGEAGKGFIQTLLHTRQLSRLATLWCRGCEIDWTQLHLQAARRRVAFPRYPFAQEPCDLNAALKRDAERRLALGRERAAQAPADDSALPPVPQAWFAATLEVRKAKALSQKQLQAFWSEQVQAQDDVGSLIASALLDGAEARDGETADQPLFNVQRALCQETVDALQVCTQRQGITLETLMVAGWALLANRHVRSKYAQLGVIRQLDCDEPQAIPTRIQTVGRQKVAPWLSEVEQQLEKCLDHAGATLDQIQHWVDDAPLFDSAIAVLPVSQTRPLPEVVAALFAAQPELPLALVAQVEAHGVQLHLDCRGRETSQEQLDQLLEQFVTLLDGLAHHPLKNPAALPMRSKGEGRKAFWKTLEQLNQQEQTS